MALNNPGNGDVPPTSLLRATLQPEAMANSPAGYAYDYTRNCYVKGGNSIAVRDVCAALAERDGLRAENAELLAALKGIHACYVASGKDGGASVVPYWGKSNDEIKALWDVATASIVRAEGK